MKPTRFLSLVALAALLMVPGLRAADKAVMPSGDAKKLAARYALTRSRIDALLGARLRPVPLPAGALPNPFYKADPAAIATPPPDKFEAPVAPDAPDLSDIDVLTKYATALKIGGYLTLGGQPHVAINAVICRVGDVVTVGTKDHPIFLRIEGITPQEVTLKLNDASYNVPIRK